MSGETLAVTQFVYIMASRPFGAIYTGRTSMLRREVDLHRAGHSEHTARYCIRTLVWFEGHEDFEAAQLRERRIKGWRRSWKEALINGMNPDWRDLSARIPRIG